MQTTKTLILCIVACLALNSCASIAPQAMSYLGEATKAKNVVGKSTHFDFAGIGVTADGYANEYNQAVMNAFQEAPDGTKVLKNLKTFKSPNNWPVFGGLGALVLGSGFISAGGSPNGGGAGSLAVGTILFLGGLGLTAINTYDFVVVGEPASD